MKTIRQLAKDLGVTRQYIQKVIHQLPTTKQPKQLKRQYQITDQVEADIKAFIATDHRKKTTENHKTKNYKVVQLLENQNQELKQQNKFLQNELAKSSSDLKEAHVLLNQEQQLHLNDQKKLTGPKKNEQTNIKRKKYKQSLSWWKRLFS